MAISVSDFIQGVRYPLNDFRDTTNPEYFDAELVSYLNRALFLLSLALAAHEWRGLMTRIVQSVNNKVISLPSDFIKEYYLRIDGQEDELHPSDDGIDVAEGYYSIIGSQAFINAEDGTDVILVYFRSYPSVSVDSDLPCPDWMSPYLHNIVVFLALNRNEFALSVESSLVKDAARQIAGVVDGYGTRGEPQQISMPW